MADADWGDTATSDSENARYWAAETDPKKLSNRFRGQLRYFRKWLEDTGRAERIRRMWACCWGNAPDGGGDTAQMLPSGGQGEMLEVNTNEVMTLVEQTSAILLNQKPAAKAVARNADFSSLAQTEFAEALLDFLEEEKGWEDLDGQQLTLALIASEAWQVDSWDRTAGNFEGADETGAMVADGDIVSGVYSPFDVCYDPLTQSDKRLQWIAFRYRVNRFDWAQRFPKVADKFLKYQPETGGGEGWSDEDNWELTQWNRRGFQNPRDTMVWVWELRHLPSPALPKGRLVRFLAPDVVISDSMPGVYPYVSGEVSRLHAYQLRAKAVPGSLAGYSHHFDLLSLQEGVDLCTTAMVSAANAGGVDNVWVKTGSNYQPEAVGGGLKVWEGEMKPERIEGPQFSAQVPALSNILREAMVRRVGLNSLALGEQQHQMPAQLAALLQAQAVQYINSLQASLAKVFAESRTGRLYLYKEFADSTRVAMIAGAGNSWAVQEWNGEDLANFERVIVEEVPAVLKTPAGKMQLADNLLQHEKITTADEYLTLVATGRLEPMFQGQKANQLRIQKEKELLMKGIGMPPVQMGPMGQPVMGPTGLPIFADVPDPNQQFIRPTITDTPWLDIPEYAGVIANPVTRNQPEVVKAVTELISYKMALWHQTPPILMQLLGCPQELIMALAPSPPPGEVPGPAPQGAKPEPGGPSKLPAAQGLPQGSPPIKLPAPPKNPLNGAPQPPVQTGQG